MSDLLRGRKAPAYIAVEGPIGVGKTRLAEALARSDHWAGSALDQMYRDVLGREPDPEPEPQMRESL